MEQVQQRIRARYGSDLEAATDERLARIWRVWYACPPNVPLEWRADVLCGDSPGIDQHNALAELRKRFSILPLKRSEYQTVLELAHEWTRTQSYIKTTLRLHREAIMRQLAFHDADAEASARLAAFRAYIHLRVQKPSLLRKRTPRIAEIAEVRDLIARYSDDRTRARRVLNEIIFDAKGVRAGKVVAFAKRAYGVPHPPDDVPHHRFIARLDALGICSQSRLQQFGAEHFGTLSREERREFAELLLRKLAGKDCYPGLAVWLVDNATVFREFDWRPDDIRREAESRGMDCPARLSKWASDLGLGLKLNKGNTRDVKGRGVQRSLGLLTPAPAFIPRKK